MIKILSSIIAFLALGLLLVVGSPIKHPIVALQLAVAEPPASLPVPVDGVRPSAIRDSWRAPRTGGRYHQGVDIFAKEGTPVRSTTEGIIIKRGQNRLGGNVVWVMGPGRQMHYYAHLSGFSAFEIGDWVMVGDIIGFVGDTGNARGTPHHLHYGVYEHGRRAINPFPLLQQRSVKTGLTARADVALQVSSTVLAGLAHVNATAAANNQTAKGQARTYVMRLLTLRYRVIKDYALF